MRASHFVIEEILETLDNPEMLPEICNKYGSRYKEDRELKAILCDVVDSLTCDTDIENTRKELKKLANKRKFLHGSGGTDLGLSDRRRGSSERVMR